MTEADTHRHSVHAQLRRALASPVRAAGLREVARRSGTHSSHLTTWLGGRDSALSVSAIERVAAAVGLAIRVRTVRDRSTPRPPTG